MQQIKNNKTKKAALPTASSIQKVICFDGSSHARTECVKIGEFFFKIGEVNKKDSGHVYEIGGTKYRISNGKIAWSITQNRYIIIADTHEKPLITGANFEINYADITHYMTTVSPVFIMINDGSVDLRMGEIMVTPEGIKRNNLVYDFACGKYQTRAAAASNRNFKSQKEKLGNRPSYNNLNNNIYSLNEYDMSFIKQTFAKGAPNYFKPKAFDCLLPYNYGLEIETDLGYLPEAYYFQFGAAPLRDGSIHGTEITTDIFNNKSVNITDYVIQMMTAINNFTACTSNNSLHVNVSGFQNNVQFRIALYNLYRRLEPEIEAFIPRYKRDAKYYATKNGGPKDHCQIMPALFPTTYQPKDGSYEEYLEKADKLLFQMLNNGQPESTTSNRKTRRHVAQGQPKWEHFGRYHTLNLEPLYFGEPQYSRVEYRVHSGTVNPIKTYMWMIMCSAITKYAEVNAKEILTGKSKIMLLDVINQYIEMSNLTQTNKEMMYNAISTYVQTRVEENNQRIFRHDGMCQDEFDNDNRYTFRHNGVDFKSILLG